MKTAKKAARRGRHPNPGDLKQPFSLILSPDELSFLRKIAQEENLSVAAVIRKAIYDMLTENNPEFRRVIAQKATEKFVGDIQGILGVRLRAVERKRHIAEIVKALGY